MVVAAVAHLVVKQCLHCLAAAADQVDQAADQEVVTSMVTAAAMAVDPQAAVARPLAAVVCLVAAVEDQVDQAEDQVAQAEDQEDLGVGTWTSGSLLSGSTARTVGYHHHHGHQADRPSSRIGYGCYKLGNRSQAFLFRNVVLQLLAVWAVKQDVWFIA